VVAAVAAGFTCVGCSPFSVTVTSPLNLRARKRRVSIATRLTHSTGSCTSFAAPRSIHTLCMSASVIGHVAPVSARHNSLSA
jgi:hypothetical protein